MFNIYEDSAKALLELKNEEAGEILLAIFKEQMSGNSNNFTGFKKITYDLIKGQIDRDRALRETRKQIGSKGGKSKTTLEASDNQTITKPQANESTSTNTNTNITTLESHTPTLHQEIIDYLNHKCGTDFRATTKATREHINARIKEGFTPKDFKQVIDKKYLEWANAPNMAQYLRPQTLFGTKFESYLNQPWSSGARGSQTDIAMAQYAAMEDVIDVVCQNSVGVLAPPTEFYANRMIGGR